MIKIIYGTWGSGKTTAVLNMIQEDAKNGIRSFLLVPDQEALQFERHTLDILPTSSQLNLEVLGFSRLYNRVCREYGGLSYSYLTSPMRSLLMWKSLHDLDGQLESLGKSSTDPRVTDMMISAVNEFKANGVNVASLELVANKLDADSPLRARLRDLSMIYACFDNLIAEKYSDSADDLQRLCDVLKAHDFFKGANVYIDSFTSFTAVQHRIIERIFKSADNVTVTLSLSSPNSSGISTKSIEESQKKLIDSAKKCGEYETIVLDKNMRACSPCLNYLATNIWKMGADSNTAPTPDESIITEICDTPYAEAEAVAAHVRQLLREGARCRDIVIISRDPEKYRGILDTALKKSDIPFYFAQKAELCTMPSVKFILSALRIKKYNWQKNDVISYIKTGLCNIDPREADLFEEYINTWNIHGNSFLDGEWTMNPDGITSKLSSRGEEILKCANRVRIQLTEPLVKLFITLDAAENIADMCRAIYAFMVEVELEEKLASLAKKAADRKDLKQARELSGIYALMLRTLADVGEIIGDEVADSEEFMLILKNIFDKTDIGTIPTSIDEVTIGSASMLRASNPKYAFVIGLCEGEFPASVKDNGFLSSNDRDKLASYGIELAGNDSTRSSDELMYVERAFATPSHKLFVLTHKAEINGATRFPSLAFNRIEKLFGKDDDDNAKLKPRTYSLLDFDDVIPAPKNAAGILRSMEDSPKKEALRVAIGEYIPEFAAMSSTEATADKCSVSADMVKKIMGDSIVLSSTSFEKYVKCPFSYFCSEILALREEKNSNFNSNNMGSFVHYILETLIKNAIPDDSSKPVPSDEELVKRADAAIKAYLEKICPPSLMDSKKLKHLYSRLKKLSLLLVRNTVKEFSESDFRPVFYELRADGENGNPKALEFELEDKTKITFKGVIDRVDLYKKGNDVYVRIVDYKTGDKQFSIADIEKGINLQMLIYLFTLCRNTSAQFKKAIGADNGKALPAGVIYLSAAIPTIEAEGYENSEQVLLSAESALKRSGLILNDKEILLAMNHKLDPAFLASTIKKPQAELTGDALMNAEGFDAIYKKIDETIKNIVGELRAGVADAKPLISSKDNPCTYCAAKALCRKTTAKGDNDGKEMD